MKTLFTTSIIILFSGFLFAQNESPIKKGNFMIGGSISIDKNSYDKSDPKVFIDGPYLHVKAMSIMSNINLNYLICDHISLGLTLESLISSSKEKYYLNSEYTKFIRNDFFIGPAIRWYIHSGFYLSSSAEFGAYHYDLKENPIEWKKFLFSIGTGYTFSLGKSVAIEPSLRYYHQYTKAVKVASGFEKYDGLQFSLGIQLFFDLKKQNKKLSGNEKV
jgi:hypothetical protein